MRMEPPWSPPRARSAWPAATSAALPLEDPPAVRERSQGLRTGPVREVWLPPEKHRSSQAAVKGAERLQVLRLEVETILLGDPGHVSGRGRGDGHDGLRAVWCGPT